MECRGIIESPQLLAQINQTSILTVADGKSTRATGKSEAWSGPSAFPAANRQYSIDEVKGPLQSGRSYRPQGPEAV